VYLEAKAHQICVFFCYVALFTLMMFDLDAKLNGIIFLILFATLLWGIRVERLTVLISDG